MLDGCCSLPEDLILAATVVLALMVFADRISRGLLARMAVRSPALQGELGLIQGVTRGVVIGLALMVFLDSVGISITPLIASLGIGTAAVALALQDTLANLFAGIYMMAENQFRRVILSNSKAANRAGSRRSAGAARISGC
jgi:small-conductance mechanosensitive channel